MCFGEPLSPNIVKYQEGRSTVDRPREEQHSKNHANHPKHQCRNPHQCWKISFLCWRTRWIPQEQIQSHPSWRTRSVLRIPWQSVLEISHKGRQAADSFRNIFSSRPWSLVCCKLFLIGESWSQDVHWSEVCQVGIIHLDDKTNSNLQRLEVSPSSSRFWWTC